VSSFLYDLGRHCYRARRTVLLVWLAILIAVGGGALALHGSFDDTFSIPGASSQKALDQLRMTFPEAAYGTATMIVVLPEDRTMDDPGIKRVIERHSASIKELSFVKDVQTPYNEYLDGMISANKRAGIATVLVDGSVSTITPADKEVLLHAAEDLANDIPGATVKMGGEIFSTDMPKVTIVEGVGVVLALVVLVFTLGSLVAAGLPLLNAIVGVAVAMAIVWGFTGLMPVSSTTPMLALMLGLAVGIDYALFILSRHRDQLATGMDDEESVAQAVGTAGSAVVFAGLTVIIALVGLAVANIPFLTVMGVFAAVAVAIGVAIALTLLPALMSYTRRWLAPKAKKPRKAVKPRSAFAERGGMSGWWVRTVTRVPLLTIVIVVLALGALSYPAKDLRLALPNSGQHSVTATDRQTFDLVSEHFGVGFNGPLVVTAAIVESHDPLGIMAGLKDDIEAMPGVEMVVLSTPNMNADTGIVQVIPTTGPDDPATEDLVYALRGKAQQWREEYQTETAVTGFTAVGIDVSSRLGGALLPFGIFVVGLSLVLLTMVFRSIWVPIKASLGYLLSVGAAFGATTLVFNQGYLRQFINLEEPVPIISFLPIILMGILFGLAMDYEVFLVSRMREEHVHGEDARQAVHDGFVHSAKVVVAAALIMFSVFAFFVPMGDGPIKPIAFGLAVGVAIDAFLVRMTLVPAVMHMLGEHAWWLPRWLDRLLPSMDVEGESLHHQLGLAHWPAPDADYALYTEGFGVARQLFPEQNLAVRKGEVVVVEGHDLSRAALLLGLTGRLSGTTGEAKVQGYVLPEQAGRVRRASVYLEGGPGIGRDLARSKAPLVVLDEAAHLAEPDAAALSALAANLGQRTLIVGVEHADAVASLLPNPTIVSLGAPQAQLVSTSSQGGRS